MKKFLAIALFIPITLLYGCLSYRAAIPTYIPEDLRDLAGGAYHTWGGFTTLGLIDLDNKVIEAKYKAVSIGIGGIVDLTESTSDQILIALSALSGPLAYFVGLKTLSSKHVSRKDYLRAGNLPPEEFRKQEAS